MAYGAINADTINTSTPGGIIGAGNATGFKNRIINGAMMIDQRNAGASQSITNGTGTYTADRWRVYYDATSATLSSQQTTTAPSGFSNSLALTVGTAGSIAAGTNCTVMQLIEGLNCADLACSTASAKDLTLSFWVRSSVTGTFNVSLLINSYSYVSTYTINAANTFEYKTISIPALTSGTPTTPSNTTYIQARWDLGCGSTVTTGTANSWVSGTYFKTTGTTSLITTAGATFYITGVQLEVGASASSFEVLDYTRQLQLCQRYYIKYSSSGAGLVGVSGQIAGSNQGWFWFPNVMRATPSSSFSGAAINDTTTNLTITSATIETGKNNCIGVRYYGSTSPFATLGLCGLIYCNTAGGGYIDFSAEL